MEGILILKIHLGSHIDGLDSLITHVRDSLIEEGYLDTHLSVEDAYISNDTLFLKIHIFNLHPFIPSSIELKGYMFSYPSFHAIKRKFVGNKASLNRIKNYLKVLDEFTHTKSILKRSGDTLTIENIEPIHIAGNLTIGDSISGSIEVLKELLNIYISKERIYIEMGIGLPLTKPLSLSFIYSKEISQIYRAVLKGKGWSFGISHHASIRKSGPYLSIRTRGLSGYVEYSGGWRMELILDTLWSLVKGFYSSTDYTFAGGIDDIIGFPENSIRTSRYLIAGLRIPIVKGISLIGQTYWIEESRAQSSFGIEFHSKHLRVMIAKGGGNSPLLHVKIRK